MSIKFSEVGNGSLSPSLQTSLYKKALGIWQRFCKKIYGIENLNSKNFHFTSAAKWTDVQLVKFENDFDVLLSIEGFQGVRKEILIREFSMSL